MLKLCDTACKQWSQWKHYCHSLLAHMTSPNSHCFHTKMLTIGCQPLVGLVAEHWKVARALHFLALSGNPPSAPHGTKMRMPPGELSGWAEERAVCCESASEREREKQSSKVTFMQTAWNICITVCTRWTPYSHFLYLTWVYRVYSIYRPPLNKVSALLLPHTLISITFDKWYFSGVSQFV